jgi:TetR/AcrR family transcriptional regulator, fatty acid metabolism regulator protein
MPAPADTRPMSKPSPRRLPRDERVGHILAVTREMLSEIGHEAIVTAEVARRCGISEATIYKYFESKRDLLIQVAVQWFEEELREPRPTTKGRSVFEALRQVVWHSISTVRRQPALARFVLLELRPDPGFRKMPIFQINRRFTEHVADVLREGIRAGELRDDVPVPLLRDMVFGCIEHQTWAFLRGEGDFSDDALADGITTVIYRGMLAQQPQKQEVSVDALSRTAQRFEQIAGRLERALEPQRRSASPRSRTAG